jgi:hypothetical protein
MGNKRPEFDCKITAEGFKPLNFEVGKLFESPHTRYEDFPKTKLKVNDEEFELPIYDHNFTLER